MLVGGATRVPKVQEKLLKAVKRSVIVQAVIHCIYYLICCMYNFINIIVFDCS